MSQQNKLNVLWQEVSTKRVFQFKNILKDFYLLHKYDLRFVRPGQLRIRFDRELVPDCANCAKNCCHGAENTVSLRLVDIARLLDAGLAEAIDLDNQSFREDPYFKTNKKLLRSLNNDSWNFFPVLKRINNICPYLDRKKRCTIYAHRPLTCRRFPYVLATSKRDLLFSKKCYNPKKSESAKLPAQLFQDSIDSYNERVKDLILINYAKQELIELGLGRYLNITE